MRPGALLALVVLVSSCAAVREQPARERFSDHALTLERYAAWSQMLYQRGAEAPPGGRVF